MSPDNEILPCHVPAASRTKHLRLSAPAATHQSTARLFVFPTSETERWTKPTCTMIDHLLFNLSTMVSPSRNKAHGPLSWPAVIGIASDFFFLSSDAPGVRDTIPAFLAPFASLATFSASAETRNSSPRNPWRASKPGCQTPTSTNPIRKPIS